MIKCLNVTQKLINMIYITLDIHGNMLTICFINPSKMLIVVIMISRSCVRDSLSTNNDMSSRFSRNSEAFTSKFKKSCRNVSSAQQLCDTR